jgi:hypothetical protein
MSDESKQQTVNRIHVKWSEHDMSARRRLLEYIEEHPGVDRVYLLDHGVKDVGSYQLVYLIFAGLVIAKMEPNQRLYPVGREHTHVVDDS